MLTKIGRYLFALPFLIFGIFHLVKGGGMAGYVPSYIPGGAFWVYLTGAAHIAAAVSIIIEKKIRLACILLGVLLLVFVFTVHLPAAIGGNMPGSMINILKDLALAGSAWYIGGHYKNSMQQQAEA